MVELNSVSNTSASSLPLGENKKIPIVIGVTGHRNIIEKDKELLKASIKMELEKLRQDYPYSNIVMLSTLTRGADTLAAICARELDIKLVCALPLPAEEYMNDFTGEDLQTFNELLDYAYDSFVVPNTEEIPQTIDREFQYRQAGIYIASHSHILLALWDGTSLGQADYGTSKMVDLMLNGTFLPENGKSMYTGENEAVLHIYTPNEITDADSLGNVGQVSWLGKVENLRSSLAETEEFNRLMEKASGNDYNILPDRDYEDHMLDRFEYFYSKADKLSVDFQNKYRNVLARLAVIGTVITLAFLLYDDILMHWLIVVCGIMLVFAGVVLHYAKKSDCQNHYIEYRALAEGLRVQAFLHYAGSSIQASELFTWSQQIEKAWIMKALRVLSIGPSPSRKNDIIECWIHDQKVYHENASSRVKVDYDRSERNLDIAIAVSILLYIGVFILEITVGDLARTPLLEIGNLHTYRILFSVALGTISAGTLFIANFYGKQSLSRQVSDHANMALFYQRMEDQLNRFGQSDELLRYIAHEELIENSNWSSYKSDNKIGLEIG